MIMDSKGLGLKLNGTLSVNLEDKSGQVENRHGGFECL